MAYTSIPAIVLMLEYFLGGILRISSFPFAAANDRIYHKTVATAPHLAPVFPFTDTRSEKTVRWNMRYTGILMVLEGVLLALPLTRGGNFTLALGCFLTSAAVWSQSRARLPYWLPCVNFALAWVVWWMEKTGRRAAHI